MGTVYGLRDLLKDTKHPIWRLAQAALALIGLIVVTYHGVEGAHEAATLDLSDAAGAGAALLSGKLLYQTLKG